MFLKKSSQKIKGYVDIMAFGFFIERFLNLAMNAGIEIWNIKKIDDATINFSTNIQGLKQLSPIASKTGCKYKVMNKVGLPFLAIKYKKRKLFLALFLMISAFIYFYGLHIWNIEIVGDFSFPIVDIRSELEKENIKKGVLKKNIDIAKIKNSIYIRRHDISWIGFNFKGTKLIVEVKEAKLKPEIKELDFVPCDIISDKDGMIYKLNVLEGKEVVKEGDIVKSGDTLISGVISSDWSPNRYVNSKGEIYIKTWHTYKEIFPMDRDLIYYTGGLQNKYVLEIQKYKINFGNNDTKFEKYDTIITDSNLNLFGIINLPIKLTKISFKELGVDTLKLSEAQATKEAIKNIEKRFKSNGTIINKDIKVTCEKNNIIIIETIECIEKVGTRRKIDVNIEGNDINNG